MTYVQLDGVDDFIEMDSPQLSVADLDVTVDVALDDWTPSSEEDLFTDRNSGDGFTLAVHTSGGFRVYTNGTVNTTTDPGLTDGTRHTIRALYDGAAGTVEIYVDGSLHDTETASIPASLDANPFTSLYVGSGIIGASDNASGKFYGFTAIYDGTTEIDVDFANLAGGATSGTATAGGTVTIDGSSVTQVGLTLTFEAAFGVGVDTTPSSGDWVDLTSRLRNSAGISWKVGRNSELDRVDAGSGSLLLDNADQALTPSNASSPYYPDVKPMVRVRLKANWQATEYSVFEGYVRGWNRVWARGATAEAVRLSITDGTILLAQARTSTTYSSETSGTRVGNLLDAAGWPSGDRDIDTGESTLQAYGAEDRNVLASIRQAAESESGIFYIAPNGDAIFRDRYSRVTATSLHTFSLADEHDLVTAYDDQRLFNDIAVTPDGLTTQRAEDTASQSEYGKRLLELGTIITDEAEAEDAANWQLGRYSEPRERIGTLTLQGRTSNAVQKQVLARGLGDKVTVTVPETGATVAFIERIEHKINAESWRTTWTLSPAFGETVWLIGITGASEVGETTRLGY